MTHYTEPTEAPRLRPGDTVDMPVRSTGTSRVAETPCCARQVRMNWEDYTHYVDHPQRLGAWFDRRCAGCEWPYRLRPQAQDRVVFEVKRPPRPYRRRRY